MTTQDYVLYVGALISLYITGYGIGLKIRAAKDFMNQI